MPRRPRVLLADYPLHIVQRGINREPCFFTGEDYYCYLHWLEESARACGCAIALDAVAGATLRAVANRFYRRTGSLWEGRYKSSVVQAESYLLACQRYIELNPVRAGMVVDPGQYPWSSYRANGLGQPDGRLTQHELYRSLGRGCGEREAAYRTLFRLELDAEAIDDIRQALQLGMPVGNERFAELICGQLGIRHNTGKRGRPKGAVDEKSSLPITGQQDFGF